MIQHKPNGMPKTVAELREDRRRLRLEVEIEKLATIKESVRSRPTRESFDFPADWVGDYADRAELIRDGFEFGSPISTPNDRRQGRYYPIFQNEVQLAMLRGPARILCARNSYAIGLLEGVTSYVVGTGFTRRVIAKRGTKLEVPESLIEKAQAVIDEYCDETDWDGLTEELFWREREDGESFLRLGMDEDGQTWARTVEPEQVSQSACDPKRHATEDTLFGVISKPGDVQYVTAYGVLYMANPSQGEEVQAFRPWWKGDSTGDVILHNKINGKRSIKRGLTDFCFDAYDALSMSSKLRRNMGAGAAVQAAIAWVEQYEAAGLSSVQAFQDSGKDGTITDTLSGRTTDFERYGPGSKLRIDKGRQYVDPPSATNAGAHAEVLQACLRGASVKWNAPEWLGSGLHDTSSFASSLTAESPFIIRVKRVQRPLKTRDRKVMLIVLRHAAESGRLPPNILDYVDVQSEPPSPEARDSLQEAQENQIYFSLGEKSLQTISQEQGRDYEQEQANREEWTERTGGMAGGMPLPGEDPTGQPGANPPTVPKPLMPGAPAGAGDPFTEAEWLECGGVGGKPGPCPSDKQAKGILARASAFVGEHAKATIKKAGNFVVQKYQALEQQYGRKGAMLIMGASIALTPIPVPGTSFAPIALAKAYTYLKSKMHEAEDLLEPNDLQSLVAAVRETMTGAFEAAGEEMPDISDEDILKALQEHGGTNEP